MKIAILLPYKENFSPSYPGAVSIFVRKYNGNLFQNDVISRIQQHVYKHRYDDRISDWCAACFRKNIDRRTDVFTCSAFVSYVLTNMGILKLSTNWTIVRASDLSSKSKYLKWNIEYQPDTYVGTYKGEKKNYTKHYTLIEKPFK